VRRSAPDTFFSYFSDFSLIPLRTVIITKTIFFSLKPVREDIQIQKHKPKQSPDIEHSFFTFFLLFIFIFFAPLIFLLLQYPRNRLPKAEDSPLFSREEALYPSPHSGTRSLKHEDKRTRVYNKTKTNKFRLPTKPKTSPWLQDLPHRRRHP
jgi:hypothetical protein